MHETCRQFVHCSHTQVVVESRSKINKNTCDSRLPMFVDLSKFTASMRVSMSRPISTQKASEIAQYCLPDQRIQVFLRRVSKLFCRQVASFGKLMKLICNMSS